MADGFGGRELCLFLYLSHEARAWRDQNACTSCYTEGNARCLAFWVLAAQTAKMKGEMSVRKSDKYNRKFQTDNKPGLILNSFPEYFCQGCYLWVSVLPPPPIRRGYSFFWLTHWKLRMVFKCNARRKHCQVWLLLFWQRLRCGQLASHLVCPLRPWNNQWQWLFKVGYSLSS